MMLINQIHCSWILNIHLNRGYHAFYMNNQNDNHLVYNGEQILRGIFLVKSVICACLLIFFLDLSCDTGPYIRNNVQY